MRERFTTSILMGLVLLHTPSLFAVVPADSPRRCTVQLEAYRFRVAGFALREWSLSTGQQAALLAELDDFSKRVEEMVASAEPCLGGSRASATFTGSLSVEGQSDGTPFDPDDPFTIPEEEMALLLEPKRNVIKELLRDGKPHEALGLMRAFAIWDFLEPRLTKVVREVVENLGAVAIEWKSLEHRELPQGMSQDLPGTFRYAELTVSIFGTFEPPPPPPPPECRDRRDNDNDGLFDHPADPGCQNPDDNDERNNDSPPPPPRCYWSRGPLTLGFGPFGILTDTGEGLGSVPAAVLEGETPFRLICPRFTFAFGIGVEGGGWKAESSIIGFGAGVRFRARKNTWSTFGAGIAVSLVSTFVNHPKGESQGGGSLFVGPTLVIERIETPWWLVLPPNLELRVGGLVPLPEIGNLTGIVGGVIFYWGERR